MKLTFFIEFVKVNKVKMNTNRCATGIQSYSLAHRMLKDIFSQNSGKKAD
ncbi:MAG: hypothetical protein KDD40_02315 [Bdellovibrionales bacterium]|nr:hypothetical protein [Bdellovibrionales bacterium]